MAKKLEICTQEEYERAVEAVEKVWDAKEGTPEHEVKTVLVGLIHEYEGSEPFFSHGGPPDDERA